MFTQEQSVISSFPGVPETPVDNSKDVAVTGELETNNNDSLFPTPTLHDADHQQDSGEVNEKNVMPPFCIGCGTHHNCMPFSILGNDISFDPDDSEGTNVMTLSKAPLAPVCIGCGTHHDHEHSSNLGNDVSSNPNIDFDSNTVPFNDVCLETLDTNSVTEAYAAMGCIMNAVLQLVDVMQKGMKENKFVRESIEIYDRFKNELIRALLHPEAYDALRNVELVLLRILGENLNARLNSNADELSVSEKTMEVKKTCDHIAELVVEEYAKMMVDNNDANKQVILESFRNGDVATVIKADFFAQISEKIINEYEKYNELRNNVVKIVKNEMLSDYEKVSTLAKLIL